MPEDPIPWERKIETRQAFLDALQDLLADPDFPAENIRTVDFLGALHAWLTDTDGGAGMLDAPSGQHVTWGDLHRLVIVGAGYE